MYSEIYSPGIGGGCFLLCGPVPDALLLLAFSPDGMGVCGQYQWWYFSMQVCVCTSRKQI